MLRELNRTKTLYFSYLMVRLMWISTGPFTCRYPYERLLCIDIHAGLYNVLDSGNW